MKIAIDIRCMAGGSTSEYGLILPEILKQVINDNPHDSFLLLTDQVYTGDIPIDGNVTVIAGGPPARRALLLKFWYNIKLPAILKKNDVDVFVTGPGMCSLNTATAQCLVIDDLSYLHKSQTPAKAGSLVGKLYMTKFIKKAQRIVTISPLLKHEIINRYRMDKTKVSVVQSVEEKYKPLTATEKDNLRARYTGGKNYFLIPGEQEESKEIVNLLKAFSVFKKRQKSDWKLVMTGAVSAQFKNFYKVLSNYRYRDDVVLTEKNDDTTVANWLGAAYGLVCAGVAHKISTLVPASLRMGVPVILATHAAMTEMAGDAALYADTGDHRDIADKMMLLYKDESLRNHHIEKGIQAARCFTAQYAATRFMQAIRETAGIKSPVSI